MIKHRNYKVKVFTIRNASVYYSLGGNQPIAIVLQQETMWVPYLGSIRIGLMSLPEQKEFLGFKVKNKMWRELLF